MIVVLISIMRSAVNTQRSVLIAAGTCRPESVHGEKLFLSGKPLPSPSLRSPRRPAGGGDETTGMHRGPSGRYPGPQLPQAPFGWHSLQ